MDKSFFVSDLQDYPQIQCSCGIGYFSIMICKGDYFALDHIAYHMVFSFLEKFNSQSFLRDWLCIRMSMKKPIDSW